MNAFSSDNQLLELARRGQLRLPGRWSANTRRLLDDIVYPALTVLYAFIVPVLAVIVAAPLLIALVILTGNTPETISAAAANLGPLPATLILLTTGAYILLAWLWVRLLERRGLASLGMERRQVLARYGRGLLVGLLMMSAAVGLLGLTGNLVREESAVDSGVMALGGVLLVGLGWLVQGAAEEVLDRGLLLPILGVRFGLPVAVVASSVVFAAQHLLNPNLSALALLNLFLFGVFACLYALYEGGLWGIFAIHSVWNWAQGNLFGFEVSGGVIAGVSLLDLGERGPDWFTGGDFGPEGGLAVTLVLLLASAAVWWAARRRSQTAPPA